MRWLWLFGFVAALSSPALALLTGGARDDQELKKISDLAPSMSKYCPIKPNISAQLSQNIARNMLFNETGCKKDDLLFWDQIGGHEFPSFGLPNAVWFSQSLPNSVDESFPELWKFLSAKAAQNKGAVTLPDWPSANPGPAPWRTKEEFEAARKSDPKLQALQKFLADPTVLGWQGEFVIQRGLASANKVLAASSMENPAGRPSPTMCKHLQNLLSTDKGVLSVIDYVNFKGEGLNPKEIRGAKNYRWGLKQVLELMDKIPADGVSGGIQEKEQARFFEAAKRALTGLANAYDPADAKDETERAKLEKDRKFRLGLMSENPEGGWLKRMRRTYRDGGIDPSQCQAMFPATAGGSATAAR